LNRLEASTRSESRWPVIVGIIALLTLLQFEPGRLHVMPSWFPYAAGVVLVIPMLGVTLTRRPAFMRLERAIIYLFVVLSVVLMMLTLERLIYAIISPTMPIGGNQLLASAVSIWVINVFAFGLLYWQVDRGGPDARASGHDRPPEILFPQGSEETRRPYSFIDYVFYAFAISTAFSPAEMFPDTARMKVLMMFQSAISLVTIIVVASRAINVLK